MPNEGTAPYHEGRKCPLNPLKTVCSPRSPTMHDAVFSGCASREGESGQHLKAQEVGAAVGQSSVVERHNSF